MLVVNRAKIIPNSAHPCKNKILIPNECLHIWVLSLSSNIILLFTFQIKGSGATRTVSLRHRTVPLVSRVSPFKQQSVADAICALLLGTHTQKLSVPELLNKYNEIFGRGVAQLRKEELLDVVCKSQALKVRWN